MQLIQGRSASAAPCARSAAHWSSGKRMALEHVHELTGFLPPRGLLPWKLSLVPLMLSGESYGHVGSNLPLDNSRARLAFASFMVANVFRIYQQDRFATTFQPGHDWKWVARLGGRSTEIVASYGLLSLRHIGDVVRAGLLCRRSLNCDPLCARNPVRRCRRHERRVRRTERQASRAPLRTELPACFFRVRSPQADAYIMRWIHPRLEYDAGDHDPPPSAR